MAITAAALADAFGLSAFFGGLGLDAAAVGAGVFGGADIAAGLGTAAAAGLGAADAAGAFAGADAGSALAADFAAGAPISDLTGAGLAGADFGAGTVAPEIAGAVPATAADLTGVGGSFDTLSSLSTSPALTSSSGLASNLTGVGSGANALSGATSAGQALGAPSSTITGTTAAAPTSTITGVQPGLSAPSVSAGAPGGGIAAPPPAPAGLPAGSGDVSQAALQDMFNTEFQPVPGVATPDPTAPMGFRGLDPSQIGPGYGTAPPEGPAGGGAPVTDPTQLAGDPTKVWGPMPSRSAITSADQMLRTGDIQGAMNTGDIAGVHPIGGGDVSFPGNYSGTPFSYQTPEQLFNQNPAYYQAHGIASPDALMQQYNSGMDIFNERAVGPEDFPMRIQPADQIPMSSTDPFLQPWGGGVNVAGGNDLTTQEAMQALQRQGIVPPSGAAGGTLDPGLPSPYVDRATGALINVPPNAGGAAGIAAGGPPPPGTPFDTGEFAQAPTFDWTGGSASAGAPTDIQPFDPVVNRSFATAFGGPDTPLNLASSAPPGAGTQPSDISQIFGYGNLPTVHPTGATPASLVNDLTSVSSTGASPLATPANTFDTVAAETGATTPAQTAATTAVPGGDITSAAPISGSDVFATPSSTISPEFSQTVPPLPTPRPDYAADFSSVDQLMPGTPDFAEAGAGQDPVLNQMMAANPAGVDSPAYTTFDPFNRMAGAGLDQIGGGPEVLGGPTYTAGLDTPLPVGRSYPYGAATNVFAGNTDYTGIPTAPAPVNEPDLSSLNPLTGMTNEADIAAAQANAEAEAQQGVSATELGKGNLAFINQDLGQGPFAGRQISPTETVQSVAIGPGAQPTVSLTPETTQGLTLPDLTGTTAGGDGGAGAAPAITVPGAGGENSPMPAIPNLGGPAAGPTAGPAAAPLAQTGTDPAAAALGGSGKGNQWWWPWLTAGAGPLLAGGALAYDVGKQQGWWGGNSLYPGQAELQQQAAQDAAQSRQLESYLQSGQLPPGLQAGANAAMADAEATMVSAAAARGQTVSPVDIANMKQRMAAQSAQIATQLYQQGVSQANASTALYQQLMQLAIQQDQNLSNAIGTFASALATAATPLTKLATAA